ARARALLAKRLTRRGLTLSGAAPAALLSQQAAPAGVPAALACATIRAAGVLATGQAVAIAPRVAVLMKGVLTMMLLNKLKLPSVCLALAVLAFGFGGGLTNPGGAEAQPIPLAKAEAAPRAETGDPAGAARHVTANFIVLAPSAEIARSI